MTDDYQNEDSDVFDGRFSGESEVLCDYLAGRLSPQRAAEVHQRLETDAEFLEFAAPLILAWRLPVARPPRPREELERHWAEFRRRAGLDVSSRDEPRRPATGG